MLIELLLVSLLPMLIALDKESNRTAARKLHKIRKHALFNGIARLLTN